MLLVRWDRLLLSMVIIPFPLINLWVELHFLRNSSLDVQLIYQRFPYSKCGLIIFTTPYRVYSSHRTLIIAYLHLPSKGYFTTTQREKTAENDFCGEWKVVAAVCTKYKYIVLGSKQLDIKRWHDSGKQGKWSRECGFAHTDTQTLTKVLCWY